MRALKVAGKTGQYIGLAAVIIFVLAPIAWLLLLAIRPANSATNPLNLVFSPDWTAYKQLFSLSGSGTTALIASIIQAGVATLIALPLAVLASYGLTRYRYRGRDTIGMLYLAMMLAPQLVFVIPLFVVLAKFHLVGGNWGPICAYQTFAIPFGILLLKDFFTGVPAEVEEAAFVDGCNRLTVLIRIFIPLVAPGVLVAGIFIFCLCWDNLLFAMPLTGGDSVPLTVMTLSFFTTSGISWNFIGATAVVSAIVPMALFWLFRRHMVAGLTFGAVVG